MHSLHEPTVGDGGPDRRAGASFGRALVVGGAVAIACGIGYAIFVVFTQIQLALVTIGIGWAVGRTIHRVTRGLGTRRHQVLAVVLTYFATAMGYFPAVVVALTGAADQAQQAAAASAGPAAPTAAPRAPAPAPESSPTAQAPPAPARSSTEPVTSLAAVLAVTAALTLAAPFVDVASGFGGALGLLIVFFGLRTAWRYSKGVDSPISGTHDVGTPAEGEGLP